MVWFAMKIQVAHLMLLCELLRWTACRTRELFEALMRQREAWAPWKS